jgi:Flp pilus assembly protein TadG
MNMKTEITPLRANLAVRMGHLRRRRGGALLELAICGLLLATILLGAVEGGQYFWVKSVMTEAARDGCRNGALAYQAGSGSGVNGPQGSIASVLGVIKDQFVAAKLVSSGASIPGGSPYTLGNFTVTFTSYNLTTGALVGTVTNLSNMTVGQGLMVTVTCNWSTVGAPFHDSAFALFSNNHTITTSCLMRKEAL